MDFEKLKEIEELAGKKEKEWKGVTMLQISLLQTALSQKEKEHKDLNTMFLKLKEDFKYNLKLLQDRDKELKQYDESFSKAKAFESAHVAEISDLRIKVANLVDTLESEQQARCEMQRHYRQSLIDQQAEMEAFKSTKSAEVEETLSQISHERSRHERVEAQLRSEIEAQRFELTAEIDSVLQKKDRENREKEDKMKEEVLAHQLKCKLLEKELGLVKSAQLKQAETLQQTDETRSKLKRKLQEAENDVQDISSIKNARILDVEAKVQNLEVKNASLVQEYEERRKQLDKDIRLKQANMDTVRKSFLDKEKVLEEEIRKLQSKVETCEHETRKALWDKNDIVKEHQILVNTLRREIQDFQFRFENQVKIHSTSTVAKDAEIQNLKKREDLLRAELERLKEDVERYKRELAVATQKENLLLQSKVQLKMDWKQRCQEIEQKQYAKSEELIQSLTRSRDLAVAEIRKLRRELGLEDDYVADEAGPTLTDQIENLQQQNDQLKAIIQQMTTDMQILATRQPSANDVGSLAGGDNQVIKPEGDVSSQYVKSLEEELISLKREKRKWEETMKIEKDVSPAVLPSHLPPPTQASFAHPDVQAHIGSLNKTLGDLRADRTDMSAHLQKTQVRLRHQESLLNTRESDIRKQLTRIQELEYELSSGKRRSEQEIESLKRRISDLELQLAETRREADEYYRGGIQNNLHATELGNKLSQLTVNTASKTPWMGDVVQAKQIQQLQSELTETRKILVKAKQELILGKLTKNPSKAAALNQQLREKLRLAAEQISLLMEEKTQLLEVGNGLQAELESVRNLKTKPMKSVGSDQASNTKKRDEDKVPNKLEEMEELQYQLTRQELQYAQRLSPRKVKPLPELQTPPATSTPTEVPTKDTRLHGTGSTTARDSRLGPLQYSFSSVGDNSIKDVWKMLEQEPSSPSLPGSKENTAIFSNQEHIAHQIRTVDGKSQKSRVQSQIRPKRSKGAKIRNYNIQDDEEARGRHNKRRL